MTAETVQSIERLTNALSDDYLRALAKSFDSSGSAGVIHHYRLRERDMFSMLHAFAQTIETAIDSSPQRRPVPRMTFDEMKKQTADDLRRVADLFELRARAVESGDMEAFYKLMTEELPSWHQMMLLRQADRAERRELAEQQTENDA